MFSNHSTKGGTRYVYLGDTLIAEHNNQTGVSYSHTDALGSPVARTNGAGQIIGSRTRYEPYGATAAGDVPQGIGFTGHVNDPDTGLVYMQQRYYDLIAGRFLSVDPVTTNATSGDHFNRYVYGENNPYKYVDPDGRLGVLALVPPALEAAAAWLGTSTGAAVVGASAGVALGVAIHSNDSTSAGTKPAEATPAIPAGQVGAPALGPSVSESRASPKGAQDVDKKDDAKKSDAKANEGDLKGGHTKGKRPSTKAKHEKGDERRARDQKGEKKDKRMKY
jgi:RHS repeat-associated protein